jgi:AcrR family transcriptional regulator
MRSNPPLNKGPDLVFCKKIDRAPRSDATRNRARLIALAGEAFRDGEIDLRLDALARRAGLGIGTLYRHFPTRDALVEAVYADEVEALATAARTIAANHPPAEALGAWLRLFVDHLASKKIITPALNAMVGGASPVYERSSDLVIGAIRDLAGRAVAAGEMRGDLDPVDLLRALAGVANVTSAPGWAENARRFVDVLIAGARPGDASATGSPRGVS